MHVSITISHVNGNNIAMYIEEQQMNTPKRKGGKNKPIYSLLAALNEHTQKKKKKGGKKKRKKKKNKPI